jgi:superfamily II DNA or RNA helicase
MKTLRDLDVRPTYRGRRSGVEEFLKPALQVSDSYLRAVGFFSSTAFERFGESLIDFFENSGKIRLLTSVELSKDDIEACRRNIETSEAILTDTLRKLINQNLESPRGRGAEILALLLESGLLDMRVATIEKDGGIYHDKVGVFGDSKSGDFLAFEGSLNESWNSFERNFEGVTVYKSWEEKNRAIETRNYCERLWAGKEPDLEVYDFPEAIKRDLIREWKPKKSARDGSLIEVSNLEEEEARLWDHQKRALLEFMKAGEGILAMATGTGKTKTAIAIIRRLIREGKIETVLIAMPPGNDLLDQWEEEIRPFFMSEGFSIFSHFGDQRESGAFVTIPKNGVLLSASPNPLWSVIDKLPQDVLGKTLLVFDEVHGAGSQGNLDASHRVKKRPFYRLGLSATPDREYDEEGSDFLEKYFGGVIFTYGIKEAIEDGILCEFDYVPNSFELSEEDKRRLKEEYKKFHGSQKTSQPMSRTMLWTNLARVVKTAEGKLPVVTQYLRDHPSDLEKAVIFVGEEDYGLPIQRVIHTLTDKFHTYFSGDDKSDLKKFAEGDLDCLITCKRLSQGIDIRALEKVILVASDRARLMTTQRLGRCLRTDPRNPGKKARVVDFIRRDAEREAEDQNFENSDLARSEWLTNLARTKRRNQA